MRSTSKLEVSLFGLVRAFAMGGALLALLGVVACVLALRSDSSHVSLDELNTESFEENGSLATASSRAVSVPPEVKTYLAGDNMKVMDGWLESIPNPEQKQDFVDNLAEVIAQAESRDVNVLAAINNYKTIKLDRLNKGAFGEYAKAGRVAGLLTAILGLSLLLALTSLILVLLAIERNTRALSSLPSAQQASP